VGPALILCDVNVLLHALFARSPHHERCRSAIDAIHDDADVAISEIVSSAVVRIATNPRVWTPPASPTEVFAFLDAWREGLGCLRVDPGERHWQVFRDLVLATGVRGPDVTDAYLAALAIEHGCEWWTTDRGFARFPGLRWRYLLA
jgi:hypothetical protein